MTASDVAWMAGYALANVLSLGAAARAYHERKWVEFGLMASTAVFAIIGFLVVAYKVSGWPS